MNNQTITNFFKNFYSALIAGFMIGIGGSVYLAVENKALGSILFALGLLTILTFKLNLFTGKAPYICQNDLKYFGLVVETWFGNFVGTLLAATMIRNTRVYNMIIDTCISIVKIKLADSIISLFVLGLLCGVLMFIAVDSYNKLSKNKNFSATVITIFCVSVFILAGFEHSIANMFYFMLTDYPITSWILPLITISFGNILGGNFFCASVAAFERVK